MTSESRLLQQKLNIGHFIIESEQRNDGVCRSYHAITEEKFNFLYWVHFKGTVEYENKVIFWVLSISLIYPLEMFKRQNQFLHQWGSGKSKNELNITSLVA